MQGKKRKIKSEEKKLSVENYYPQVERAFVYVPRVQSYAARVFICIRISLRVNATSPLFLFLCFFHFIYFLHFSRM